MSRDFSRQSDLVPEEALADTPCVVVGVGAVGRNVALQLTAIGAKNITIIDFDSVEETNVTTQGYAHLDIGLSKVGACARAMNEIDPDLAPRQIAGRFRPQCLDGVDSPAIFCCVDKMEARKLIHEHCRSKCMFWADARMLGEMCNVFCAHDVESHERYAGTLFSDSDSEPGRCTARSTIYCASFCAAAMVHQFCRWLRGQRPMSVGGSLLEFLPVDEAAFAQ